MKIIFDWIRRVNGGFRRNGCPMHAAGLTYFAMLAIMPILCCILVLAKACGLDDYARTQINVRIDAAIANVEKGQDDQLARLAPVSEEERRKKQIAAEEFAAQARTVVNQLFNRMDKFDVSTFGWIGFGFLLWTIISTLGMVEVSFNRIWGVAKPRPVWKRAYIYLFMMVVLPVLAAVAMSLPVLNVVKDVLVATMGSVWLTKWVSDGIIWILESLAFRFAVAFMSVSVMFAFFFWIMPNCRVKIRGAWYGGMITSFLFCCWLKACAVAQVGIARSSALYGSFAFFPIILAWFCISWQLILLGANMVREFERGPESFR